MRMLVLKAVMACACLAQPAVTSSQDEAEWNRLRETKNEAELLSFMEKYPDSRYASFASRRIDMLAWEQVDKTNPQAVKDFLRRYPDLQVEIPAAMQAISTTPGSAGSAGSQPAAGRTGASRQAEGIDKVLRDLTFAYENRNIERIRTIWPGISKDTLKEVQQSFKDGSAIKMTLEPTSPAHIEGGTAIAICRQTLDTTQSGRPNVMTSLVSIKLKRLGQEWVIESIQ
jgi:hypothetical protein